MRSFTRGARRERVAQPTLSQQIMKLEKELGAKLFERSQHQVRLTESGENFFRSAKPILAKIGGQRVIAFFLPERGSCAVNAVLWKDAGVEAPYASSRIKVSLRPGEMVEFDHGAREQMNLLCGADASTLTVVAPAELITTGSTAN